MASCLQTLPLEILVTIAGYLSNTDVSAFSKALTDIKGLISQKSFHHWQRLLGVYTILLNDAFDAIDRDRRQKAEAAAPVVATSLISNVREAEKFLNIRVPQILKEMRVVTSDDSHLLLDDVFLALQELGNDTATAFTSIVDGMGANEGSKIFRAALDKVLPVASAISLLPVPVQKAVSTHSSTGDFLLLTAYLLFTKLKPEDIVRLLPRYSKYGYINEQSVAEYLSYLLLFLKIYRLDTTLWPNALRSTKDQVTDRVKWRYCNGSPLSAQGIQILQYRIESWFADFHEARTQVSTDPVQPCLTQEQKEFVEFNIKKGEIFKVRAYAGTGKTKCLVDYAKRRPKQNILYVAYNKMAKLDAQHRFIRCFNVKCMTLHGVAYNALSVVNPAVDLQVKGKAPVKTGSASQPSSSRSKKAPKTSSRRGKLARAVSAPDDNEFVRNWEIETIVTAMKLTLDSVAEVFTTEYDWPEEPSSWSGAFSSKRPTVGTAKSPKNPENLARVIITGIDRFCQSKDPEPSVVHLSMAQCRTKLCNPDLAIKWVKRFWKMVVSGKAPMMTHDCYLKMFSLTKNSDADELTFGQYDIVMFDEAQDANPCMANIILRQREAAGIIIIGDPYQMIYGFRGAKNECFDDNKLPPTQTFHLTKSFRFGQEIANVANLILGAAGETTPVQGVNTDVPSPAVFLPPPPGCKGGPPSRNHTVIFRTNTELVKYFFSSFAKNPEKAVCLKTSAANASRQIIPLLRAGYYLWKGRPTKHPRLRGVSTFEEAKAYVQREDDPESADSDDVDLPALALVVGMEKYYAGYGYGTESGQASFLDILDASANSIVDDPGYADVILTTTHQSKGLEWDDVIVADDFATLVLDRRTGANQAWVQEATNLLYVACTRARKRLQLSPGMAVFFTNRVGTYRFFVSPEQNSACPCCRGKHPFNTFLGDDLTAENAADSTLAINYLSSTPSPCIGYEALVPRRNPFAADGWIDHHSKPLNPAEIPKGVGLPAIACTNCILAWRSLTNKMHGDLFRFADGIKARSGFERHILHADQQVFWAGRFPPGVQAHIPHANRMSLEQAYRPEMRMGWARVENVGRIGESLVAWSDFVYGKVRDAGLEFEDDDVDEFIMAFES